VELTDAHTTLYIHEIAMHHEHDIDNFKPPFGMAEGDAIPQATFKINTPDHMSSLKICLHSIHRIFDAVLSVDPIKLRIFPCLVFVRILYAGIALLKLSSIATAPGNPLASVFGPHDLKVGEYLGNLVNALAKTSDHGKYRSVGEFWEQVRMMRLWWLKNGAPKIPPEESQVHPLNQTLTVESSTCTEPSHDTFEVEASNNVEMSNIIPSALSTDIMTATNPDSNHANTITGPPTFQAPESLDLSIFDTDVNMDLSGFDMLGQFENGITWSWPGWNFESALQGTGAETL